MNTNARFGSTGTTKDFVQNCMTDKNFGQINIKIVISIQQVPLYEILVIL